MKRVSLISLHETVYLRGCPICREVGLIRSGHWVSALGPSITFSNSSAV
jgi:hypothetical protein